MRAPDFSLPDQNGVIRSLAEFAGQWLVVYFYPKDNTPGCTVEACSFRDWQEELKKEGVAVVGISKDSVASHQKFASEQKLNFPILSDPEGAVIKAYGAWGLKKFAGKEYEGILRNTYLVNPEGEIIKEYQKVTPKEHVQEILNDIRELKD